MKFAKKVFNCISPGNHKSYNEKDQVKKLIFVEWESLKQYS